MKHILAVDDNPVNLTLVRETLREYYKVSIVTSGEQAIRFLEKKTPDLILLDVCMPGTDGIETLSQIKMFPNVQWQVIIVTALADEDVVSDCERIGVAGCLTKPILPEELLRTVSEVLGDQIEYKG